MPFLDVDFSQIKENYTEKLSIFQQFLEDHKTDTGDFKYVKEYLEPKNFGFRSLIGNAYCDGGINMEKVCSFLSVNNSEFQIGIALYKYFIPMGMIFLLINFLNDLLDKSTSRIKEFDIKQLVISFVKLAFGLCLLSWGPKILAILVEATNAFLYQINENDLFGSSDNSDRIKLYETIMKQLNGKKFLELLPMALGALVLTLAQIIPNAIVIFQAISRKVTIIIRVGIAPFSLTDLYQSISNSKALIYIKKLFADLFHGVLMILVIKICYTLEVAHLSNMLNVGNALPTTNQMLETTLYGFAAAGLISSSKQIINDALGC